MLGNLRGKITYANVMATLAVFAAIGGGAFAVGAVRGGQGKVVACYPKNGKRERSLRILVNGSHCKKGEKQVTWDKSPQTGTGGGTGTPACKGNDANDIMMKVGPFCMDRYEDSVWSKPHGGTQYGLTPGDYPCNPNGNNCKGKIYARSVPGVKPSAYITWLQAQQALANSGKRLPTNAEWQMAAAGTPDPTSRVVGGVQCNSFGPTVVPTGSRTKCISRWHVNDMVGNLNEWVDQWVPPSQFPQDCYDWGSFSDDTLCLKGGRPAAYGADAQGNGVRGPGVLLRGGGFVDGTSAGVFAVAGTQPPNAVASHFGFRGVR